MRQRAATRLAWPLWALSVALVAFVLIRAVSRSLGIVSGRGGFTPSGGGGVAAGGAGLVFIIAFSTVGALVASKRPSNPIGWLLLASGLCFTIGGYTSILGDFGSTRAHAYAHSFGWIWAAGFVLAATFTILLFPTGSLPSRRWRPVAWVAGGALTAFVLGSMLAPGVIPGEHARNPLGVGGPLGSVFTALRGAFGVLLFAVLASIVSVAVRFRRADATEREQLKWLVYAGGVILASLVAHDPIDRAFGPSQFATNLENASASAALALIPIAAGIAIFKYRLYDIDVVINKTLVYALLAAFITAVYVAIVVGIGQAIGSKRNLGLSILATAVVAVGFQPVRDRVQHFANRLVYGKRATPYEVLSEFSERMSGAYAAEDLLPRMARILAEGTGASRADVWLNVGSDLHPEASWPPDAAPPEPIAIADGELPSIEGIDRLLPVRHRGELLGALSIVKSRGDALRPAEEKLMEDLASGAGLVMRNVRLTAELLLRLEELRRSRQRIVAAQDEERRKLERNLHDGAQQQLVALQVKLSLAQRLAEEDCRVKDQLASLKAEAGEALENLRDLARGIYPPLLADQGLRAALASQARKAAFPVHVEVDALSRYPQDQEAAVYFCVLEALQNVAKYAGATFATVRLFEDGGQLAFEVTDDGAGFDTNTTSYGTGLQGMADRLSAQGGTLEVRSSPRRGTTVIGRVPVPALEAAVR